MSSCDADGLAAAEGDQEHPIVLPDLGLSGIPITVSLWHVPLGARVRYGESLVEILAGDATVDLSAPVPGRLVAKHVAEDDPVRPGQVLGLIRAPE